MLSEFPEQAPLDLPLRKKRIEKERKRNKFQFSSVQFSRSVVSDSATLWIAARQASLSTAKSCPILCNPTDCSPPGSCVRGIFQARILEWAPVSYSRGSFQFRDRIHVSCVSSIGRQVLNHCTTWEASDVLLRVTKSRGDTILGFLEGFDQDEGNIFS